MRKLLHAISISSMLFLSAIITAEASTTVMKCSLENGREVNVQWDNSALYYSYGKPGVKPELTLSGDEAHFGHESFASSEGVYYRFTSGKYDYVTYFSETNQGTISNLGIFKNEKLIRQIKCKDYFQSQLPGLYKPVSSTIPVDDGTVDWSVNEDTGETGDASPQAENQPHEQEQQAPVKIEIKDITSDHKYNISAEHNVTRHIYVYSLVDSITVSGLSLDRGSCYSWNGKPLTIAYGKRVDFPLPIDSQIAYANNGWAWFPAPGKKYNQCMWSEIVVKTNKGDWTFPLNTNK